MMHNLGMNVLPPMIIATCCYLWCSIGVFRQGNDNAHALMWLFYAGANTCFIWYELKK